MLFPETEQLQLFPNGVSRERLSTNTLNKAMPVQRWANFIAGFSVEFVVSCLQGRSPGGLVLDPFLGCATTMVGARCMGFHSVGYEAHPLFGLLAEAKVRRYEPSDVDSIRKTFARSRKARPLSESADKFLSKLFEPGTLEQLLRASNGIERVAPELQPLATAIFLKIAEAACGSQTDGIYKAPTSRKRSVLFETALETVFSNFLDDIGSPWYRDWVSSSDAVVHAASSTEMGAVATGSVDSIITSPPYLNNFDFAEMTRMQLYLLGMASSWGEITTRVRSRLITNTTTALKGRKDEEYQKACRADLPRRLVTELDDLVASLEGERRTRAGKKEYDYLVYPYYSQIRSVLAECVRTLEPGGRIHWVVSDAALYGNYIETQEHTAGLMRDVGFANVEIETLRRRGHRWKLKKRDGAPGRLGEYCIVGTKP